MVDTDAYLSRKHINFDFTFFRNTSTTFPISAPSVGGVYIVLFEQSNKKL